MADEKLTELTEATTVDADDLLYVVTDPAGTPTSKKAKRSTVSPWEVIGDTTVSSPVASVSHTFDPSLYAELKVCVLCLTNADSGVTEEFFWGYQFQQSNNTVDGDKAGWVTVNTTGDTATFSLGATIILPPSTGSSPNLGFYRTVGETGASNAEGINSVDLSATAKIVYFYSSDSSDFDVATATNTTGGRIITYGLRLP